MKVGIIGLGKIGACMASVYASHGFDVVGVDVNEKTITQIKQRKCPIDAIEERGLVELLERVPLAVSTDFGILRGCELVMVIVPTPSLSDGKYDNSYILSALESLCEVLSAETKKPVVVIKSTVLPGSCEKEFIPFLEKHNKEIKLCYSAEMVGLGKVVSDLEHPEELLVGEQDREAGDKLASFYQQLFEGRRMPALKRMSLWNAELSKVALNVFLTNKMSLANTIARLCDQNPTGDVNSVLDFVGSDSRIGRSTLGSGLGFGGPCFPRDCKAFISVADDENSIIPKSIDEINISQVAFIYDSLVYRFCHPMPKVVSILGITYKPDIQLLDASRAVMLVEKWLSIGVAVKIHDPKGLPEAEKVFGSKVYYANSIEDCVENSELAVICTAWDCYKELSGEMVKTKMKNPRVYDCWRICDVNEMKRQGIKYHAFGVCD